MKINSKNQQNLRAGIGTLKEKNLHASLIQWASKPGDRFEVEIDGYIIDIVRDDLLIEIQTKNFSGIRKKLINLCDKHKIQLIYPIAQEKWIIKEEADGERIRRRKSPKRGRVEDIFSELIRTPIILKEPNLSICVLLVELNEVWKNDGKGSWRRKHWSIDNRYLIDVQEIHEFHQPKDLMRLLPPTLPDPFTNNDVAAHLGITKSLARKTTYCLRKMEEIKIVGKRGRAYLMSNAN
jgi:hypothetical protein